MKRNTQRVLQLIKRLEEELKKKQDFFFWDRPFLEDITQPVEIYQNRTDDDIDARITNAFTLEKLCTEITHLCST